MRILFLISGPRVPCSRFRVLQYLPYLEARGHECVVAPSRPAKYRGLPLLGNRLSELPRILCRVSDCLYAWWSRFDVAVVERELFSSGFFGIERWLRRIVPAMILDVDDAVFLLHPRKIAALATMCDAVIAGNTLLREQLLPFNANTMVIPTSLDLARYVLRSEADRLAGQPVIGWTGLADNYPYLKLIAQPLREMAAQCDFEFRVIAERPPGRDVLGSLTGVRVQFVPWREATEIEDLQSFDIGVMPLEDTPWTRHKCGLKVLQYMAVGVPAVASPVGVNSEIIQHEHNGFLADSPSQWSGILGRLLRDAPLRRTIGAAGRARVGEGYSVARNVAALENVLAVVRPRNS